MSVLGDQPPREWLDRFVRRFVARRPNIQDHEAETLGTELWSSAQLLQPEEVADLAAEVLPRGWQP